MVKVGDKVRYNGIGDSNEVLKKGSVYDVIALSTILDDWIYVRSDKNSGYNGLNASEKIVQPFTYLSERQYEVVEDKPKAEIKPGDKVKLIDKFYEHEAFKKLSRYHRKDIANQSGKELKILDISFGLVRYSATDDGLWTIPVELLEKVEQLPKAPKPGDLFRVIGKGTNYHHFELGEIVELIKVETSMGMYLLRGYSKSRNEVCNQVLYGSDIEPCTKHRYTDEQIAEARQIVYEEMTAMCTIRAIMVRRYPYKGCYSRDVDGRYMDKPHTLAMFLEYKGFAEKKFEEGNHAIAVCLPTDEWNDDIGNMVAVCKLTGRKLPDWL